MLVVACVHGRLMVADLRRVHMRALSTPGSLLNEELFGECQPRQRRVWATAPSAPFEQDVLLYYLI